MKYHNAHTENARTDALPPPSEGHHQVHPPHLVQGSNNQAIRPQIVRSSSKINQITQLPQESGSSVLSLFYQPPSLPAVTTDNDKQRDYALNANNLGPLPPSLCIYGYPYTPKVDSSHSVTPTDPNLTQSGSRGRASQIDGDTASIDSNEILSWKGRTQSSTIVRGAQERISDCITEQNDYTRGRGALHPDTHCNGSLASSLTSRSSHSRSSHRSTSCSSVHRTPKPRPHSGIIPLDSASPVPAKSMLYHSMKLASASLVSLRSASQLAGNIFKNGTESPRSFEWGSDHETESTDGRVLTPDKDPFAGPLPPSPVSTSLTTPNIPTHPYAAVDITHMSDQSLTPRARKSSRTTRNLHGLRSEVGVDILQTPVRTSPLPNRSAYKVEPILTSPCTPISRKNSKAHGSSLSTGSSSCNSTTYPFPPTPASITSGHDLFGSFDSGNPIGPWSQNEVPFPDSPEVHGLVISTLQGSSEPPVRSIKVRPGLTEHGAFELDHSDSRPHSPFPLHSISTVSTNSILGASVDLSDSHPTDLPNMRSIRPDSNVISGQDAVVVAPATITTNDADTFADACGGKTKKRQIVSPTAWFLDSDSESCLDQEQSACSDDQGAKVPLCSDVLDGDREPLLQRGNRRSFWDSSSMFEQVYGHTGIASESDARTETSETSEEKLLELDEAWPLPPHRTIVVDGPSEEGWHDVESIVEVCAYSDIVKFITQSNEIITSMLLVKASYRMRGVLVIPSGYPLRL